MSIHLLEEISSPALDALDRERTVVLLTVSPLEQHGPHLPLGVDGFSGQHFARALAERLLTARPGWTAVLAPTLHLGCFTFDAPGTVRIRQRVVRDAVVDYGRSLARAGFRFILVSNGHGGPGHLVALEEASAIVSRRHHVMMASLTGRLAWEYLSGGFVPRVETALGRRLSDVERQALADDAHGGWWETSLMLLLRPDLVDGGYRTLPGARYSLPARLVPNYPLRSGGQGYVGHPAMADPAFAQALLEVLMTEGLSLVEGLLDGRLRPSAARSPFFVLPFFRTNFWPVAGAAVGVALAVTLWARQTGRTGRA